MDLTQLVQQHLPSDRKTSSTGFYVNCPMCVSMGEPRPDTKHRGGFTRNSDGGFVYHCHNCKFSTGWKNNGPVGKKLMSFLSTIGIDSKQIPIRLRLLRPNEVLETKVKYKPKFDVALNFDTVKLPNGARSFESWVEDDDPSPLFIQAFSYMAERGEAVFNGSTYYWTPETKYGINQRVIIPFFHHGKIVGYTARCFTGNKKLRKYYSQHPTDFMYNQELLEGDQEVALLLEGVLDAISIGGVGVMGNNLSPKQLNLLKWSKKRVILIPDMNKAGQNLFEQVVDNGWEVSLVAQDNVWGNGIEDCADATKRFGKLYTLETILNNATKNKMKLDIYKAGLFRL